MVSPAVSEALSGATANVAMHWQESPPLLPAPQGSTQQNNAPGMLQQSKRFVRERPWTAVGSIFVAGILLSFLFPRK